MGKRTPWWIVKGVPNPNQSPEVRRKISEANKGRIAWNKGKHGVYSEETRAVMRRKAKERWEDPEYREMMCKAFKGRIPWNRGKHVFVGEDNPHYGRRHSEESKRKMSKANKGRIPWNKGLTKENNIKLAEIGRKTSESLRGRFIGEDNPHYGKHHSEETLRKLSKIATERLKDPRNHPFYGKHHSEKTKAKLRKARMKQKIPFEYTSIERAIEKVLDQLGVSYKHSFNLGDKFLCDFAIPSSRLIIECDGDYWHSLPHARLRDKSKDAYAKKCGWTVLRLSESKINEDIQYCKEKIKEGTRTW